MANTLEIIVKAKDQASSVLNGIGKSAGSLGTSFVNLGSSVLRVGTIAGGALVAGIGAGTGALTKMAFESASLEGIQAAFEGITASSGDTKAALREATLGMVSDRELMISYNQAAQLVSTTFADQLPEAMGYLTKISASTGEDMGYLMDSLVRGIGRTSGPILDNLSVQVDLAMGTERAAEMFGKEADELSKTEIQAGLMDVVMEQLRANTEKMPDIAGTATQSWAALKTTFANLKDEVGLKFLPVLTDLGAKISTFVQSDRFQEWIERALEWVGKFGEKIIEISDHLLAGDLQGALGTVFSSDVVSKIMAVVDALSAFVGQVSTFVNEHSEELKTALKAIGAVLAAAAIASAIAGIASAIAALATPIGAIVVAVGLLAAAWEGDWLGMRTKLTAFWQRVQPTLETIRAWLAEKIPAALGYLRNLFGSHSDEVSGTVTGLWAKISAAYETAIAWIKGVVESALAFMRGWWDEHGESVMIIVNKLWSFIHGMFEVKVAVVKGIVEGFTAALTWLWDTFGGWFMESVGSVWNMVQRQFENGIKIVGEIFDLFAAILTGDWETAKESLIEIASLMWDSLSATFSTGKEILLGLVSAATEGFKSLWGSIDARQIGANLVNPIIEAINRIVSAWNSLDFSIPGFNIQLPGTTILGKQIGGGTLDWGGVSIGTPNLPTIPEFAQGGIVTQPTLALIGERGPEAVVPLNEYEHNVTYNVTANYAYQDERTLRDDLRLLSMLAGA